MNESPASGGGGRRRSGLQALSAPQAARLRARFSELVDEHGSEIEVARRVGISQQSVNKIRHGAPIGLEVAKRLCIFDGVPLEAILRGAQPALLRALRDHRGRWSEATTLCLLTESRQSAHARLSADDWTSWLDEIERTLAVVLRGPPAKHLRRHE